MIFIIFLFSTREIKNINEIVSNYVIYCKKYFPKSLNKAGFFTRLKLYIPFFKIFSVTKQGSRKFVRILGIKLTFRNKRKEFLQNLRIVLKSQNDKLIQLERKSNEIQKKLCEIQKFTNEDK